MADESLTIAKLLPHLAPALQPARNLLLAMRLMASGGTDDAHAANTMIVTCGIGYQKPLIFLRILMEEVSRIATHQIAIAPCCCPRMTEGEAAFLELIETAGDATPNARAALTRLTGTLDHLPALFVAQGLAAAMADLGRPVSL
ncbi:MAG: hypothetical protein JWL66_72 [Sphingomonadales bacterium]|nr:hypothetical protein [Sphingomonadales bacterium]